MALAWGASPVVLMPTDPPSWVLPPALGVRVTLWLVPPAAKVRAPLPVMDPVVLPVPPCATVRAVLRADRLVMSLLAPEAAKPERLAGPHTPPL